MIYTVKTMVTDWLRHTSGSSSAAFCTFLRSSKSENLLVAHACPDSYSTVAHQPSWCDVVHVAATISITPYVYYSRMYSTTAALVFRTYCWICVEQKMLLCKLKGFTPGALFYSAIWLASSCLLHHYNPTKASHFLIKTSHQNIRS
jgi:hypothetical protein